MMTCFQCSTIHEVIVTVLQVLSSRNVCHVFHYDTLLQVLTFKFTQSHVSTARYWQKLPDLHSCNIMFTQCIMITTISAYNQVFALPTRLLFVSIKHFDEHESDFNDKYLTDHCQLINWFDKYITLVIIL